MVFVLVFSCISNFREAMLVGVHQCEEISIFRKNKL